MFNIKIWSNLAWCCELYSLKFGNAFGQEIVHELSACTSRPRLLTDAHQNLEILKYLIYYNTTNIGAIEDAINDLNSQVKLNITTTAKKYSCN